jgi:hypothetical protein
VSEPSPGASDNAKTRYTSFAMESLGEQNAKWSCYVRPDYQPLLLKIPAHARPMKPRYPNISPALLSPASMVPMVCSYRLRFLSSVLSAFCNRISGVSNVSDRGDCRRCDSVYQLIFLIYRKKLTRSEIYKPKSYSTHIPFRPCSRWFVIQPLPQPTLLFDRITCLIRYSPRIRKGSEGVHLEQR